MDRAKRVNYGVINQAKNESQRIDLLEAEIKKVDYICLTDAIAHPDMCGPVMLNYLQNEEIQNMRMGTQHKWKIQVIRDEWGEPPVKGGVIIREIMKPLVDKTGRMLTSKVINDMRRRGSFEEKFIEKREFVIDSMGCVECSYDDAVYFLTTYGVHFETGHALCGYKELSSGPCRAPGGGMKHVWYWRYKEAPPWVYSKLEKIK